MDSNKPKKPRLKGTKQQEENPFKKIEIEPEYYDLSGAMREFCISVLTGFIWEAKNTMNFIAYHPELSECESLLHRLTWLRDKKEWWPQEDEMLELALVDAARLIPKLWD